MASKKITNQTGKVILSRKQKHHGGWQTKLQSLINTNNNMKVSQIGQTSYGTQSRRAEMLFHMFRELRTELKFMIEDPVNLKKKHVDGLVQLWIQENLAPATIDNKISVLRTIKWTHLSRQISA